MARTVVVEPNPGGHRFQAAGSVLSRAARDGEVLLLTSVGARERDEFRAFLDGTGHPVREVFTTALPGTVEVHRALRELQAEQAEQPADTVVVMEGDDHLRTWFLRARLPGRPRVIFFLTRYPARLSLRSGRSFWQIRIAKAVLVLAARLTGRLHRAAGFAGRDDFTRGLLVKRARDPIECSAHSRDRAALRRELDLPADRTLVGVCGGVNARKNPPLVLAATLAVGPRADLVLAGPVSDDMREWLAGLPEEERGRVHVDDGFLSNERLDRYIAAVDVVVLAMALEGPSGIQGKALAAAVPVVTAGSRTRQRELLATRGGAAAEPEPASIAAAIGQVLATGDGPDESAFPMPTADTFAAAVLGR